MGRLLQHTFFWVVAGAALMVPLAAQAKNAPEASAPVAPAGVDPVAADPVVELASPVVAAPEPPMDPELKAIEELRAKLSGTTWSLDLTPQAGGKAIADTLAFADRQVTSTVLTQDGYGASNITLTRQGGTVLWETMQSKEVGDPVVFWRGEINGDRMSGVMTKRQPDGKTQSYSFTGASVKQ